MNKRKFEMAKLSYIAVAFIILLSGLVSFPGWAKTPSKYVTTQAQQQAMSPQEALQKLKGGNKRFLNNRLRHYNYLAIAKYTALNGQFPFAIVLNCVDSRSVPDITFDQGLANIFVARSAGNTIGLEVLASMEFAVEYAGAKLIVIMGHTHCGAIRAACENLEKGNLRFLTAEIRPAVDQIKRVENDKFSCDNEETVNEIAKQNVLNQMREVANDPVLEKSIRMKKVMVIGAMHDLATGKVTFFDTQGHGLN